MLLNLSFFLVGSLRTPPTVSLVDDKEAAKESEG
jgi:hypothetical protein